MMNCTTDELLTRARFTQDQYRGIRGRNEAPTSTPVQPMPVATDQTLPARPLDISPSTPIDRLYFLFSADHHDF